MRRSPRHWDKAARDGGRVALAGKYFGNSFNLGESPLALSDDLVIISRMIERHDIPNDLDACQVLLRAQAASLVEDDVTIASQSATITSQSATITSQSATITSQTQKIEELTTEMEKLRKLLSQFVNGHRSEKRILPAADQAWLPFDSSEEFQAAKAEAEAQAEAIVQTYTVTRTITKKKRDESLPSHLPRVEKVIEGNDAQQNCPTHGPRKPIGYDTTETLVYKRPELYVLVKKYPKYACPGNPACGVASPERPTSLVEGDRYDSSVAATVVEAKWFHHLPIYRHQDVFAGSGWTPSRSTLLNLVGQVQFVITPFIAYMTRLVQQDLGVGIDDTSCRMLLPRTPPIVVPGDAKSKRLAEKVAEARAKGDSSLLAKMWVYSGLHLVLQHLRLPRVAAPGRPRRLLPRQPLYCARRLLFGKPERCDPQRPTFDVRRLLGARAPQGRGGDDVLAGKRTALGNDPGAVRHRDPRQGSGMAGSSGVAPA